MNVADIRRELRLLHHGGCYVYGRGGATVEIIGASFIADEESIFGEVNKAYVERELRWYGSQSLNINDFTGGAPKLWNECSGADGSVNSNYGWCMFSEENGNQYVNVRQELVRDPCSRRAIAIYTRPSMHTDAVKNGRQDFMCTNAVEYFLRGAYIHCVVQMRSSDAVLGYRNDRVWHKRVLQQLAVELGAALGTVHWQAGSLHVYERHFKLLETL